MPPHADSSISIVSFIIACIVSLVTTGTTIISTRKVRGILYIFLCSLHVLGFKLQVGLFLSDNVSHSHAQHFSKPFLASTFALFVSSSSWHLSAS